MTDRNPWPLLAALDELLAREGWQKDIEVLVAMERRIGIETNTLIALLRALDLIYPIRVDRVDFDEDDPPPPFLRSRDAAAMLEESVRSLTIEGFRIDIEIKEGGIASARMVAVREIGDPNYVKSKFGEWLEPTNPDYQRFYADVRYESHEPAARTRAALEAGWRLGLWPMAREETSAGR